MTPGLPARSAQSSLGRAYLWTLAARGERGVLDILAILHRGIYKHLYALGLSSIHVLTREGHRHGLDRVFPALGHRAGQLSTDDHRP